MTIRRLADTYLSLQLYDKIWANNAPLLNATQALGATWRRSIRARGGYWLGTADFVGAREEMLEMFLYGLGRELREYLGSVMSWQGLLVKAELTLGGLLYVRQWTDLANRVQVIYSRLGDNLLTNGSVESAAWSPNFNGPDVSTGQSAVWVSDGAVSEFISSSLVPCSGVYVEQSILIVAGKAYEFQMSVNIIGGTWKVVIRKHGAGIDPLTYEPLGVLGSTSDNTAGVKTMRVTIPVTNTYAGLVDIVVYQLGILWGSIYCDGATFRESAIQSRTSWYATPQSQTEYGTLETVLLESSMSDATANARAQTYLAQHGWPRTLPPVSISSAVSGQPDGLALTFAGYAWTLRNKYVSSLLAGTTQDASVMLSSLVAASEFVTLGYVQPNATQYQVDSRAPLRTWDVILALIQAGDTTGARWLGGVYANRQFRYQAASLAPDYHYRGGQLLTTAGELILPWQAQPGLVYLDDLPAGPGSLTADAADDPHVLYMEEVEADFGAYLSGAGGLNFTHTAGSAAQ